MLKRIFIIIGFIILGLFAVAQKNQGILDYINTYKALAIDEMQRSGVPASIKLAQGIHETEAGNSELARKGNNHFGIKCKSNWKGEKIYHDDDARGECFRSYSSAEDSYRDHSDFLRNNDRYAFLFKLEPKDYKGWAYGLREAGYATNIKYSQLIIKLIEDYNLQDYTLLALDKSSGKEPEKIVEKETIGDNSEQVEPVSNYPAGVFELNKTKAIFVKAGSSLLAIATEYDLPLARLIDFNDLLNDESPKKGQLIFLQRKRKTGINIYHVMQAGETIYDVCQMEGIRMESLLQYNMLPAGVRVAEGEKVYLQEKAPLKPMLLEEKSRLQKITTQQDDVATQLHTVQPKETLYSIARKYNVTVGQLQEWNKLNTFDLKTGQQIKIKPL
jgi:LysM repeat protein